MRRSGLSVISYQLSVICVKGDGTRDKEEEKNLTQRREDAKIKAWRLSGLSEAGVRILVTKITLNIDIKF